MQDTLQILTIVLSGATAASAVLALRQWEAGNVFRKRLAGIVRQSWAPAEGAAKNRRVGAVINMLSRLSLPEEGWQNSRIRIRFLQAGIRNKNAPQYYFALKTLLTLVLPVALAVSLRFTQPQIPLVSVMGLALSVAAAGYYLPELALRVITRRRIGRMRDKLPDMIELMVVCAESGMGINAAIARISREMARTSPDLAQEFYLSSLEMRAGASRVEALRNLALRTRLEEMDDLVSMLVQADRFGTGLAQSLRVHSDMMRSRRSQRAEELADKIPVKMVLPLGLFIFPTLFIVVLGPAIIQLVEVLKDKF
jgi:tight adherence protein C